MKKLLLLSGILLSLFISCTERTSKAVEIEAIEIDSAENLCDSVIVDTVETDTIAPETEIDYIGDKVCVEIPTPSFYDDIKTTELEDMIIRTTLMINKNRDKEELVYYTRNGWDTVHVYDGVSGVIIIEPKDSINHDVDTLIFTRSDINKFLKLNDIKRLEITSLFFERKSNDTLSFSIGFFIPDSDVGYWLNLHHTSQGNIFEEEPYTLGEDDF